MEAFIPVVIGLLLVAPAIWQQWRARHSRQVWRYEAGKMVLKEEPLKITFSIWSTSKSFSWNRSRRVWEADEV